jgi:uncharacterized protein (TIGR03437 family)
LKLFSSINRAAPCLAGLFCAVSAFAGPVQITVTPASIPVATAGTFYSQTFSATGGVGSYAWSAALSGGGSLPSWLAIDQSSGTLSGTPTTNGTLTITVRATDMNGNPGQETVSLAINFSGTVITTNLPTGMAIVNISAASGNTAGANGAKPAAGNLAWDDPYNTLGQLLEYTVQPGTYTMRVIDPADAASIFPSLTQNQLNGMWTAWNSSINGNNYVTSYLAFDSSAASNSTQTQLFSGADNGPGTADPASAYADAANGYTANNVFTPPFFNEIRNGTLQTTYTFNTQTTLIFVVPDYPPGNQGGGVSVLIAPSNGTPGLTTQTLPAGQVNVAYSQNLTPTGGSGIYNWTAAGLPPGLSLSATGASSVLSGTPTHIGAYSVQITVTDPVAGSSFASQITLNIGAPSPALGITQTTLPAGEKGIAYSQTLTATGGYGSFTWSISEGAPLSLNAAGSSAVLSSSGVLNAAGSLSPFTVTVTDAAGDSFTSSPLTVTVDSTVAVTTSSLPNAAQGESWAVQLSVNGGAGSYTWSASGMPPWLNLASATGILSGVPSAAGTFPFSVTVTDSMGGTNTASLNLGVSLPVGFLVENSATAGLVLAPANGSTPTSEAAVNGSDAALDSGGNTVVAMGTTLRRVTPGGSINAFAGAPGGSSWVAIAADPFGNLIVGDNKMHEIWRVSSDGLVQTAVATYPVANAGQQEDIRILVDVHGNYIVAEDNGSAVSLLSITPAGVQTTVTLTGGILPRSVAGLKFNQSGNYMLLDATQQALFQITPQGVVTVFTGTGLLGSGASGLDRNPLTNQFVVGSPGQLKQIPAGGGSNVTTLVSNAQLASPAAVVTLPEDFPSAVDATIPLAYFRLETSTGTSETNGYTYSLSGAGASVSTAGAPLGIAANNAALLDGQSGEVTTSLAGQILTAGSMMAWIKPAALPSTSSWPFNYIAGESAQANDFDLQISNTNVLGFYTTCCGNSLSYTPNPSTLAGQWHMVVATFDATAGTRAIYWDGALVASDNCPSCSSSINKTGTFRIGNTSNSGDFGNRYFNGKIDDVAVWSYALTAPQVYRMFATRQSGPAGSVNSLSPAGVNVSAGTTAVTISGQNFATGSTVWWTSPAGSNPAGQTTILTPSAGNATSVVVNVPSALLATAGIAGISVVNPAGVPVNQLPFTVTSQPLSISPSGGTLPSGHTNQLYGVTLQASGGSGNYTWSITNQSPGLNLGPSSATGATFSLTGTPTAPDPSPGLSLVVTLSDAISGQHLQQFYLIPVSAPLLLASSTSSVATSTGGSVSGSLTASGGVPPYNFLISGQPAGITISSGGALSGSASQAGTFNAVVSATDAANNSASASIIINVLGLTTMSLPGGAAGQFYSGTVSASGGAGPYSFSASGAPSGMTMSSSGALTGITRTGGTYSLSVTVTSGGVSATGSVSLAIANPLAFSITSASLPAGTVNVPYSQSPSATGGVPPYTWAISAGSLPQGLSIGTGGIISGTPTTAGMASFTVQATDSAGATATSPTTLLIHAPPLLVTKLTLPSGMNGVDYPQQSLAASGGISPYTWALTSGSALPTGMTLGSDGTLSGIPGAAGTFSVGITVSDSASPATRTPANISLTIRPAAPDLILTAGSLSFALSSPATTLPASQSAGVQSTVATQKISYSASVGSGASWLSIGNGSTTPDSIQISLTSAALALSPGDYQTTIAATCTSTSCTGHTQTVSVDLKVTSVPQKLQIDTTLLSFAATSAATGSISQPIVVENTGGGAITFSSVSCETGWCTAGPASGPLGGGGTVSIPVIVNPGLLQPGFYRTQVDVATSAGNGSVPVTLFIAANSGMTLAPSGQQFSMPAGSAPGNPNGSFLVSVNNATPVNWTASVLPGSSWLTLGTASGSSSSTQPGSVSFSIDPTAAGQLSQGAFYGRIEVISMDASNSPLDFEVVLNVTAPTAAVPPDLEPAGLLFITGSGGVLPPETVTVYSGSTTPLTFQASVVTDKGSGWLSVTPSTGTASATAAGVTTVNVDPTGLNAGVYTGSVSYSLSATAIREVGVTLIIPAGTTTPSAISQSSLPSAATAPGTARPRASGCNASALVPAQTGLVNSFSAPAGWPTPLAILLYNDCGQAVNNGQVVATFSNGDPPLALPLADPSNGLYSGTWSPAKAASQVSIVVSADAPGFPEALNRISGVVVPNAVPVLTPHGTLHSFDPLVGAALAPGTIVQIYGKNFAPAAAQPTTIPLPTAMTGVSVIIGGLPAPLYYVSAEQINAQIPFELQAGQQYQVIVSSNNALTTPDSIQLSPATPGLAAFADGTLIAQHNSDGSLVSQTSPAQAGEYLIAYLAGMGDTNVPVASGTASPLTPSLAVPVDAPQLTINGMQCESLPECQLLFAGLTPGLVGLYQIDFQVPSGLPAGNITVAISQDGQTSNQTVLPYQP